MHPKPCRKGNRAVKFVAMFTDFSDSGIAADHRHDALVEVLERLFRLARDVRFNVLRAPLARLFRDRCQLRQRLPILAGDIREISQTVDAFEALDCEVGLHVYTATISE